MTLFLQADLEKDQAWFIAQLKSTAVVWVL